MTPEQIALCQRLAVEAAGYRWAKELSESSRQSEAEDARIEHKVGFRCDPKASRAWWAVWEPAFQSALQERATPRNPSLAFHDIGWGASVHRAHVRRAARHARAAHDACAAFAAKVGDGVPAALVRMGERLDAVEAWASSSAVAFINVSDIAPACAVHPPGLPWVVDPLGAMRHLAHLVASGQADQWGFYEEQALCAAASTLASLDDPKRGDLYRKQRELHIQALKVKP